MFVMQRFMARMFENPPPMDRRRRHQLVIRIPGARSTRDIDLEYPE